MKYLGLIVDDKDIVTKEYVDAHTDRPAYQQTFTATNSISGWYYRIPYNENYSFEDLLNFRVHFERTGTTPAGAYAIQYAVNKVGDYWRYSIYFSTGGYAYPNTGDTIVVENMFTDTDGTLTAQM